MLKRVMIGELADKVNSFDNEDGLFVIGRVLSKDVDGLHICDMSGTDKFFFENDTHCKSISKNISEGDIVRCEFNYIECRVVIRATFLLQKSLVNPLTQRDSLFYKLNFSKIDYMMILKNRQRFFAVVRKYFDSFDFIEINTPSLVESPGVELYIEPFCTTYFDYNHNKSTYFLPTSPEFALKEVLSAGLEKIYEITRSYRNCGENSKTHRPEFYMLEWYRAYQPYEQLWDDCIELIRFIGSEIYSRDHIERGDRICRFDRLERVRIRDCFAEHSIELDNYELAPDLFIADVCRALKLDYSNQRLLKRDDLFFKFLMEKVEPNLGWNSPAILYEYPASMSTLSVKCIDNHNYGKRFELYICGVEIANGFEELTDPDAQIKNFNETLGERSVQVAELKLPERFIDALKIGIPPSSGIALGLERLFMLFEGLNSIDQTNIIGFR